MEVVPVAVGVASRAWDEQQGDLAAASRQIDSVRTSAFSPAVAEQAARFTDAWTRLASDLGADCETRAEGLRAAIADYLETDDLTFHQVAALARYLTELR
jgi:hypothetical protein